MLNFEEIRKEYKFKELHRDQVARDPAAQLSAWIEEAVKAGVNEPTAMNLATVSSDGKPSSRIVLLKGLEEGRLYFYTNYSSRKGDQLGAHPYTAITFFWPELERQVRIEGSVKRASAERSDAYFATRPLESRIGALISPQSTVIDNRKVLEDAYEKGMQQYREDPPARPMNWGGFEVEPNYYEFWQGRPGRLHDRICYSFINDGWTIERLAP